MDCFLNALLALEIGSSSTFCASVEKVVDHCKIADVEVSGFWTIVVHHDQEEWHSSQIQCSAMATAQLASKAKRTGLHPSIQETGMRLVSVDQELGLLPQRRPHCQNAGGEIAVGGALDSVLVDSDFLFETLFELQLGKMVSFGAGPFP